MVSICKYVTKFVLKVILKRLAVCEDSGHWKIGNLHAANFATYRTLARARMCWSGECTMYTWHGTIQWGGNLNSVLLRFIVLARKIHPRKNKLATNSANGLWWVFFIMELRHSWVYKLATNLLIHDLAFYLHRAKFCAGVSKFPVGFRVATTGCLCNA